MILFYAAIIIFKLLATSPVIAKQINFAAVHYPPYYNEEDRVNHGFLGQLVSDILKAEGMSVKFTFRAFSRVLIDVKEGAFDMTTVGASGDNSGLHITKPFFNAVAVLFSTKKRFPNGIVFNKLTDLKNKSLATILGTPLKKKLQDAGFRLILQKDQSNMVRMLKNGRVDFYQAVDITGLHYIRSTYPSSQGDFIRSKPINIEPISIGVSKKIDPDKKIFNRVERGIKRIYENGRLLEILKGYYGDHIPSEVLAKSLGQ